jgi:hypothetical protein
MNNGNSQLRLVSFIPLTVFQADLVTETKTFFELVGNTVIVCWRSSHKWLVASGWTAPTLLSYSLLHTELMGFWPPLSLQHIDGVNVIRDQKDGLERLAMSRTTQWGQNHHRHYHLCFQCSPSDGISRSITKYDNIFHCKNVADDPYTPYISYALCSQFPCERDWDS